MAYTAIPPTTSGSSGSASVAFTRAQSLLGSTITKVLGDDFGNDQWYRTVLVGGGTVIPNITERGGVLTLSNSASAGDFAVIYPHGATVEHIGNPQTQAWYITTRIKFATAVDAQASLYFGFAHADGAGPLIKFGLNGSQSTGVISVATTNNAGANQFTATSTVAFDTTSYHVLEAWSDTTNISFAIDGAPFTSTAVANIGTSAVTPTCVVANGTTPTARSMLSDYLYTCVGDP